MITNVVLDLIGTAETVSVFPSGLITRNICSGHTQTWTETSLKGNSNLGFSFLSMEGPLHVILRYSRLQHVLIQK